jgi:hypothetical protein
MRFMNHKHQSSDASSHCPSSKINPDELHQLHSGKRSISPEQIENARSLLEQQSCGIAYTDVLQAIIDNPWVFCQPPYSHSLELTRQLVDLHPYHSKDYKAILASEGPLARGFACIPFVGHPCPSTLFLESNKEVNSMIDDLKHAGLLQINHSTHSTTTLGGRAGIMTSASCSLWIVAPTEFGKRMLHQFLNASTALSDS